MAIEREYDPDRRPVHPGSILEDYMEEDGWNQTELADILEMSRPNLNNIINGKAGIGPLLASKLAVVFDTSPKFWADLNTKYKIWDTRAQNRAEIEKIESNLKERQADQEEKTVKT